MARPSISDHVTRLKVLEQAAAQGLSTDPSGANAPLDVETTKSPHHPSPMLPSSLPFIQLLPSAAGHHRVRARTERNRRLRSLSLLDSPGLGGVFTATPSPPWLYSGRRFADDVSSLIHSQATCGNACNPSHPPWAPLEVAAAPFQKARCVHAGGDVAAANGRSRCCASPVARDPGQCLQLHRSCAACFTSRLLYSSSCNSSIYHD